MRFMIFTAYSYPICLFIQKYTIVHWLWATGILFCTFRLTYLYVQPTKWLRLSCGES